MVAGAGFVVLAAVHQPGFGNIARMNRKQNSNTTSSLSAGLKPDRLAQ